MRIKCFLFRSFWRVYLAHSQNFTKKMFRFWPQKNRPKAEQYFLRISSNANNFMNDIFVTIIPFLIQNPPMEQIVLIADAVYIIYIA